MLIKDKGKPFRNNILLNNNWLTLIALYNILKFFKNKIMRFKGHNNIGLFGII